MLQSQTLPYFFWKSGRQLREEREREREGGWGVFDHALRIRESKWEIAGDKVVFMVLREEEGVCFISGLRALSARGCTAVTALQSDRRRRRRSQTKYYQSSKDKPWSNYAHKATAMTDHCRYPLCWSGCIRGIHSSLAIWWQLITEPLYLEAFNKS